MSTKVLSLNVCGLHDKIKRRAIFNYSRDHADIICLQETHSSKEDEQAWELEWGGKVIFSHGERNARGVCILISRKCAVDIVCEMIDPGGRYIIIKVKEAEHSFVLSNIYGPNIDNPTFFVEVLEKTVSEMDERIIIGDFNLVIDPQLDRRGSTHNNTKSMEILKQAMDELLLNDTWRDRNPEVRAYTYRRNKPYPIASRIDFALIFAGLDKQVDACFYVPGIFTDHRAYFVSITPNKVRKGTGFWKLNNSLLQRPVYQRN